VLCRVAFWRLKKFSIFKKSIGARQGLFWYAVLPIQAEVVQMNRLWQHFVYGTERTRTLSNVGIEIETQFLDEQGLPIPPAKTLVILEGNLRRPDYCDLKLELGAHNLELNIRPQKDFESLWPKVQESLGWLYALCAEHGFYPAHEPAPLFSYRGNLLLVADERDELWVGIDGRKALEYLCRCSSVQFTIDVAPSEATEIINKLWEFEVHKLDYSQNDILWRNYINHSSYDYRQDRYAGPAGFDSLYHYAYELHLHDVVMHQCKPRTATCVRDVSNLDIDLFLRSVWWHYRLRRYGSTLALEIRPFARRTDEDILVKWKQLAEILKA
jgi:hypothetical protein